MKITPASRRLKAGIFLILSIGLLYLLQNRQGQIPPLGKFLNPFAGFWQNNSLLDDLPAELNISGLDHDVSVTWDERQVPHIFAQNDHDLFMAQGYLTARDRLWQMDFQSYAASGRLSEIVGPVALEHDRYRRRIAMLHAAEKALDKAMSQQETRLALTAYADGVNAWISQLRKQELPIEYKILDYEPEPWTPLKSTLLIKMFAWDLTFRSTDYLMSRTRAALGEETMDLLFPVVQPISEPVIPKTVRFYFKPKVTSPPDGEFMPNLSAATYGSSVHTMDTRVLNGSNNWAVSGSKTRSGFPILSNDPHLGLRLPSIWYESQLTSPQRKVYGVTSPGAPGIVIGFNEDIAWGVTNAGSDVLDWYEIKFKDNSFSEYSHDGKWISTTRRIEEIRIRGKSSIHDTIIYTHHGPVSYMKGERPFDGQIPPGTAMRWIALDSSNEGQAFLKLNTARNYQEFVEAMSHFDSPAQNFVYADRHGDIAIHHNGKLPVRWNKQGRYISDGGDPSFDWSDFIPREQLPMIRNPDRGFVSSANQIPSDNYPYYLGWNFADPERAIRINERLSAMTDITPGQMISLQNDVVSHHAGMLAPVLLKYLAPDSLEEDEVKAYDALQSWSFDYHSDMIAPWVFDYWWYYLNQSIWEDDLKDLRWPHRIFTTNLIKTDPESDFFDNKETQPRETLDDLALASFKNAIETMVLEYGAFGPNWTLGKSRSTDLNHVARIPGMGRLGVETSGNSTTINATTHTHGPSWRMVVQLGPKPQAWSNYPGGQSGNPGSEHYENGVDKWVAGEMSEILFLNDEEDLPPGAVGKTILRSVQ